MAIDPLADLYDERTLRRLDGRPPTPPERPSGARSTVAAGAFVSAIALGLQTVFEPRAVEPIVEEVEPARPSSDDPVRLWFVPGAPRLTRADARPWLIR